MFYSNVMPRRFGVGAPVNSTEGQEDDCGDDERPPATPPEDDKEDE